ncbi:3-deoxy-D-manno-octulosonic-acid transferase [Geothermobacter ehrlichii]|uniref:3-deoxy-D-manno-octulosonic acid transferase n=1 Tax=Geothermobacter ehrlichii TaxID=213224 RepID=A0A5D3WNE6_9BACT|nr:3-deoxy-D-manno-octulosonic acid transferase [Geothermobacter ehrlichii]TYP00045.1 3-deoxy-D-manno-octulosonic-acid transferase [Geothermobacter ehrlichii]
MVYLLYDLILLLAAIVLTPYYLWRGLKYGKSRRGIRERLGRFAPESLRRITGRKVIWVHAVSVGETRAVVPLLRELKKGYPEHALVLTNVTETGRSVAAGLDCVDLCLFFPFDLSWVVRRVLRRLDPEIIILVETELWPNLVRQAHARNVPVALVNGRISDRSFPRYRRVRPLLAPLLKKIVLFGMQTELDAERVRRLGAPPERIRVTGNLKFDMAVPEIGDGELARFRSLLGLAPEAPVLVAGSTHQGEEELLLQAFEVCRAAHPALRLVLVPRHPERAAEVGELVRSRGFVPVLRSQCPQNAAGEGVPVVIGDTLGEMLRFYALADIVFVGGSLVPIGGHNILEASLLKKAVLFGPHMNNFKEIAQLVLFAAGGRQVDDLDELVAALTDLFGDREQRERMGRAGHALIERHAGATARTRSCLDDLLGSGR